MKLGTNDITDLKIGTTEINEVRLGSVLVWERGGGVDADAQAYFTANPAITNPLDKDAINAFFVGLKSDGTYAKQKAMYLPIWSSATANKWNIKNPLDTDAAFRLVFFGGVTHSSGGITGNGTNGYADTKLNAFSILTPNSVNLSFYNTQITGLPQTTGDMGCGFAGLEFYFWTFREDSTMKFDCNSTTLRNSFATNKNGFSMASRINNSSSKIYKSGILLNTVTGINGNSFPNANVSILALNINTINQFFSTKICSFASIGDGLTDAEALSFYNRVQTLMTHFGLNV